MMGRMVKKDFTSILAERFVAIVSFRVNKLAEPVEPLKLYEYLAKGTTVIYTGNVKVAGLPVLVADNIVRFVPLIEKAIYADIIEVRKARSIRSKCYS